MSPCINAQLVVDYAVKYSAKGAVKTEAWMEARTTVLKYSCMQTKQTPQSQSQEK